MLASDAKQELSPDNAPIPSISPLSYTPSNMLNYAYMQTYYKAQTGVCAPKTGTPIAPRCQAVVAQAMTRSARAALGCNPRGF